MKRQNDNEDFESFLKGFRPRAPQPLRREIRASAVRRRLVYAIAAGVVLAVVLRVSRLQEEKPVPDNIPREANRERLSNPPPLTIGSANEMLSGAPSLKAAIDKMTFESKSTQLIKGRHSALTVLAKEKIEL